MDTRKVHVGPIKKSLLVPGGLGVHLLHLLSNFKQLSNEVILLIGHVTFDLVIKEFRRSQSSFDLLFMGLNAVVRVSGLSASIHIQSRYELHNLIVLLPCLFVDHDADKYYRS